MLSLRADRRANARFGQAQGGAWAFAFEGSTRQQRRALGRRAMFVRAATPPRSPDLSFNRARRRALSPRPVRVRWVNVLAVAKAELRPPNWTDPAALELHRQLRKDRNAVKRLRRARRAA